MVMWKLTNVLLVVGVIVIGVILSLIILFALVKFIEFLIEEVLESIKFYGIKKNKYTKYSRLCKENMQRNTKFAR